MQIFSCPGCRQTLFFENSQCTGCGRLVAYLPSQRILTVLAQPDGGTAGVYMALGSRALRSTPYRLCQNRLDHALCNWSVPDSDPQPLCEACRLNDVIPNLAEPGALEAWGRIEAAKRRLLYAITGLGLPIASRIDDPQAGLQFRFMADGEHRKVFTGHSNGVITINIAEADDPFREKMRARLGEDYRTLLGHMRHEIGHYFWDRLVDGSPWLPGFRALFGDERLDYQAAVEQHYEQGPPADWRDRYASAYASVHPWEDWAENFAHYLHMTDTLETASAYQLTLRPRPVGGPAGRKVTARAPNGADFDSMVDAWITVSVALNSLNRGMGLKDPYPFVLSQAVFPKLRFIHHLIRHWNRGPKAIAKALKRQGLPMSTPAAGTE